MEKVFVSSLMRGNWVAVRRTAVEAVESLGLRAVLAEGTGANGESSRRTLLDQIARCDVLLLLLGADYGTPGLRGKSPVEEEFDEAVRLGLPVLALVQDGAREPGQEAFVARVRGSWEHGRVAPTFQGPDDIGLAVVRALAGLRNSGPANEQAAEAAARALELAVGQESSLAERPRVRLIAVPVVRHPLVDAVRLQDAGFTGELATCARRSGLVPNALGITQSMREDGIDLQAGTVLQLALFVGLDGAVIGEAEVSASGPLGGSALLADRVLDALRSSARFAQEVWDLLDVHDEVRQAQVVAVVPRAQYRVYATAAPGNSLTMDSMFATGPVIVPQPPMLVRRQDLAQEDTLERLRAEIRHRFELAGALHDPGRV